MVEVNPAPKKGRNWLLIGCLIVGVMGAFCIICVAGSMMFITSEQGQAIVATAAAEADATMGVVATRTPRATRTAEADEPPPTSDNSESESGEPNDNSSALDAIATAAANNNSDSDEPSENNEVLPTLGEAVEVGDVRWTVLTAEDVGNTLIDDDGFADDATTPGTFVRLSVEVENIASEEVSLWSVDLEDDQGRGFGTYDEYYLFVPDGEHCLLESLNPNVPKVCTYIFEVPADATGLAFRASDLAFLEPRTELIDLGLD